MVVVAKFYEELGEAHVTLETDHGGFYEELGEAHLPLGTGHGDLYEVVVGGPKASMKTLVLANWASMLVARHPRETTNFLVPELESEVIKYTSRESTGGRVGKDK